MWALRFTEDFSGDITEALHEHTALWSRGGNRRTSTGDEAHPLTRRSADLEPVVASYLNDLRGSGRALPGRITPQGAREPDWPHLTRIFNSNESAFKQGRQLRDLVTQARLPVAGTAYLQCPITGQINGQAWRPGPIGFHEAPGLASLLRGPRVSS